MKDDDWVPMLEDPRLQASLSGRHHFTRGVFESRTKYHGVAPDAPNPESQRRSSSNVHSSAGMVESGPTLHCVAPDAPNLRKSY